MMELTVNYQPEIKKYEQGYKISDINKAAEKDGLIGLDKVSDKANRAFNYENGTDGFQFDLNDILEAIDQEEVTIYKPFNTDEGWQWFIDKIDLHKVMNYLDC